MFCSKSLKVIFTTQHIVKQGQLKEGKYWKNNLAGVFQTPRHRLRFNHQLPSSMLNKKKLTEISIQLH